MRSRRINLLSVLLQSWLPKLMSHCNMVIKRKRKKKKRERERKNLPKSLVDVNAIPVGRLSRKGPLKQEKPNAYSSIFKTLT